MSHIRTAKELALWVKANAPTINLIDAVAWFVCMQNAKAVSNFNLQEIASLFNNGIEAITDNADIQHYLDTLWENTDSEQADQINDALISDLKIHFNVK